MTQKSFQDYYPDELAHCYGCGRLNEHGHQIKSYWDGDESVCHFLPRPYHIAVPGYVYGGLLASLIDCHGTGTAAAALYNAARQQDPDTEPNTRTLTASLHVDYHKPTPLGVELEVRGRVKSLKGRKVVIIDDSIVRGTTSRQLVRLVQEAEPKEIHFRVTSPPIKFPCYYGMDFPSRSTPRIVASIWAAMSSA